MQNEKQEIVGSDENQRTHKIFFCCFDWGIGKYIFVPNYLN